MTKSTPAIILSAGNSTRLGEPKALIKVAGKTLLEHAILRLKHAGCEPVIVVVNPQLQYDALMVSNGARIVINKTPEKGRTGSLKVGIKSLQVELGRLPKHVIMCPIDRPGWKAHHIKKLLKETTSCCLSDNRINGHPVLLAEKDLLKIMAEADAVSLRQIVRFDSIYVNNSLLSLNIDTSEDKIKLFEHNHFFTEL